MRATGTLAIAGRVRRDGKILTAKTLREFAKQHPQVEFDEESGELCFDGFLGALSRLREELEAEAQLRMPGITDAR